MRRLFYIFVALLIACPAWGANYFVSQSGAGAGTGADVDNAATVATFNAGTAPFNSLAGNTVYFLDTITTTINPPGSGAVGNNAILRGDYTDHACTFDGGGTVDYGIEISADDYFTITGLTFTDTKTAAVNSTTGSEGVTVTANTFNMSAGSGIITKSNWTISNNTFNQVGSAQMIYTLIGASGGTVSITGNTFNYTGGTNIIYIRGYGTHNITDNTFSITGGTIASLLSDFGSASESGAVTFTGNIVTSLVGFSSAAIIFKYGYFNPSISNNIITLTSATNAKPVISMVDQNSPSIFNNTLAITKATSAISLTSTGSASGVSTVSGNNITMGYTAGYAIAVGSENTSASDYSLNGAIINSNHIYGADKSGTTHGIFVGFNINATIYHNTVSNNGYGVVVKAAGATYTSGMVAYNTFSDCGIGVRIKGVNNVPIYNNTIANSTQALFISENTTGTLSTGTIIKNNLLYEGTLITVLDTSTIAANNSDYNLLYTSGSYVSYQAASKNYSEWQAMGYDANSVNSDPLFISSTNFHLQSGSPARGAGVNVGLIHLDPPDIGAEPYLQYVPWKH